MQILIVTPAPPGSQRGNRITAERWARFLRELGHGADVVERYEDQPCDLLIALHARHSAEAIARFAAEQPSRPLVLVLTGTDLYADIKSDPRAQHSLACATRLVVLHERGADDLPAAVRSRVRTIVQSQTPPPRSAAAPDATFTVCVLGHLRAVKDPLRAAAAARLLPSTSRVRIVHLGAPLDAAIAAAAQAEAASNPRYEWRGEVPRPEALAILAASRLHVLSSAMEGGANALCEALACGVPSLASRIPGSVGLLGDDYPGYFPYGDTAALAALLDRAETDAAFYEQLRAACAARAHLVEPQRERDSLRALLAELTDHAAVPAPGPERRAQRVPLERLLSKWRVASRTEAQTLVREGRVCVGGHVTRDPRRWIDPVAESVEVDGVRVGDRTTGRERVWLLLNKPRGVVATTHDPQGRPTVMDLVAAQRVPGLAPVGRLDLASAGLLLLTDDAALADRLLDPRSHVAKTYRVKVRGHATAATLDALRRDTLVEDGLTLGPMEVEVEREGPRSTWLTIRLREGKNRQIRRRLEALGHEVEVLVRTHFGPIALGDLPPRAARTLTAEELRALARCVDTNAR